MSMRSIGWTAAIVVAVACLGVGAARAADDNEQECDDIMSELNKLTTRQMNIPPPKGIGPVCAASGQLLGLLKASRETAAQCYEDGDKLDEILAAFGKGIKDIEGQIEQGCK